jgi:Ca2+-transporting ATPase
VVSGSCVFLVVLVGINTSYGQTLASLVEEDRETPLQKKLGRVAELIGMMGVAFAVLTFIALFIYWLVHLEQNGGWHSPSMSEWSKLLDIAVVCVSIVVVAVPEGLPLAVTVSLAYSMKAMLKDNILVRELAACETMGNATAVCSDKTGTLTQNRMTVLRCHVQQVAHERPPSREDLGHTTMRLLEQSIILNSAAWIEDEHVQLSVPPQDWPWRDGNQTEVALLSWLISYGFDVNASRLKYAPLLKATESFDSIKKYSSIVLKKSAEELAEEGPGAKPFRQYFKGAAEAIIAQTDRQVNAAGHPVALPGSGGAMHRDLLETVSDFSRRGLRVIAFSYRDLDEVPVIKKTEEQEIEEAKLAQAALKDNALPTGTVAPLGEHKEGETEAVPFVLDTNASESPETVVEEKEPPPITDAVLIGMVGLSDPLRPTSYRSVRLCQRAGIIVRMVAGDPVETARFISRECGIWTSKHHLCMTGAEFRRMMAEEDDATKALKINRLRVLARSSPQDKQVLVKYLQSQGHVVAATGDGTNDAPALKSADVGIAMFISGTAVCKSAADLWLMVRTHTHTYRHRRENASDTPRHRIGWQTKTIPMLTFALCLPVLFSSPLVSVCPC